MHLYEHTFIARQDVASQQVEALTEEAETLIKEMGGEVLKKEYWGLRSLAYRINKNRKGHYQLIGFRAPAEAQQELERRFRINEDILRTLTVRVDGIDPEAPSPILIKRDERRKRDRR